MKQNTIRAAAALLAAKMLAAKGINFVPMPAKSEKHLEELKKQAADIVIDLAKNAGLNTKEMESKFGSEESMPDGDLTFDSLNPYQLKGLLSDLRTRLIGSVKESVKNVKEGRAVVKLGFNNGVGMVVFLTTSQSVYDTAEKANFPGEENCGNPDCPGCNPENIVVAQTIH